MLQAPPQETDEERAGAPSAARLDWLVGGMTVCLYLIGQIVFLEGPHPYDPARYFEAAVDFPDIVADLFTLRIGLIAPVRAAVLVFGPSEASLYAVPLLSGMALVAAVFATMILLFRDRVLAASAALATGLNVNYLVNSSHIYPDVTVTATFTTALLCLLLAGRAREGTGRRWLPITLVACAGVLLGWSYLVREFSPILWPVALALVVLLRFPLRWVVVLAGSALATMLLEPLAGLFAARGEPFVRLRLLLSRGDVPIEPALERRLAEGQERLDSIFESVLVFPRLLLTWSTGWVFLALAVLFLVAVVRFRDRRLLLLAIWFGSYFVVLALVGLGSLSSGRWILNITNIRYWYPVFPPLVMGGFAGLWLLVRNGIEVKPGLRLAQASALALVALILAPGFVEFSACSRKDAWRNDPAARWDELRSWLATDDAARFGTLWADLETERLLPAYTTTTFGRTLWDGDIGTLALSLKEPPGRYDESLILVHKDRWRSHPGAARRLEELREEWSPLFVSSDGRMVVLAHESAAAGRGGEVEGEWWDLAAGFVPQARPGTCGRNPYLPPRGEDTL
jgi:hypothetical protein